MEWCKLYASLDAEPRVQAAEEKAQGSAWLLIQSFMYCTTAESAGMIPKTQVPRFGGRNLARRVSVLVSECLWIPEGDSYLLDPDVWCEERNLSDSAERKKEYDRQRIAARRAAAKAAQNGAMSYDSRTTQSYDSRATVSQNVVTQRREEKNYPPNPPPSGGNRRCKRHQRPRRGCADCSLPALAPVPDWCGTCSPARRLEDPETGRDIGPCPDCHPSVVRSA